MKKQSKFWTDDATLKDKVVFFVWLTTGLAIIGDAVYQAAAIARNERAERARLEKETEDAGVDNRCQNCHVGQLDEEACPNDNTVCIWCCVCHRDDVLDAAPSLIPAGDRNE